MARYLRWLIRLSRGTSEASAGGLHYAASTRLMRVSLMQRARPSLLLLEIPPASLLFLLSYDTTRLDRVTKFCTRHSNLSGRLLTLITLIGLSNVVKRALYTA